MEPWIALGAPGHEVPFRKSGNEECIVGGVGEEGEVIVETVGVVLASISAVAARAF